MSVPREVIDDLLPLYVAGEVSPETKAFVEQYLSRNPELAAKVRREWPSDLSGGGREGRAAAPPAELELQALRKTRGRLALQRWVFGLAITFTATAFAIDIPFRNGWPSGAHFVMQDYPVQCGALLVAGLVCWVMYYRVRRNP